jgi:hypothetical protein
MHKKLFHFYVIINNQTVGFFCSGVYQMSFSCIMLKESVLYV